jgi:hypothetical protein
MKWESSEFEDMKYQVFDSKDVLKDFPRLAVYDEFNHERAFAKYSLTDEDNGEIINPEFIVPMHNAIKYVFLCYDPNSALSEIDELKDRKLEAMRLAKVPKMYQDDILINQNPMIADVVTRFFRLINSKAYELYISGKEAIDILLEETRRPVDYNLPDDKLRTAIKSKRECFVDAKLIMDDVDAISANMDKEGADFSENVSTAYASGRGESVAERRKNKK